MQIGKPLHTIKSNLLNPRPNLIYVRRNLSQLPQHARSRPNPSMIPSHHDSAGLHPARRLPCLGVEDDGVEVAEWD
jgi:hypothetical protein